ncbi:serine/threonine-protein phosphatase 2A activator-like [Hydractinia symbiolongicarpus]|uniref:serine/threonine-protein phosphatase 2A activator-like n=1 Tax=Hydractinia symbiolongicarpus TaxID=13093 RepID=UPI00254C30E1|nr:serine/threonine-protein phosphatase 2A activator-like [Hydractinia symbiolongicarpus]
MTSTETKEVNFVQPVRRIMTLSNLVTWNNSQAHHDLVGFILTVNDAVKGKSLHDECYVSETVTKITEMLGTFKNWIKEIPPCEQPQRFGNKSYKVWAEKLLENSQSLIEPMLPENFKGAVVELKTYLEHGFGNSTRIDYGSGHELNFICFLCCLYKLKVLTENDRVAIVNLTFKKYLEVVRDLQVTYRMEPAGSHGVWGLDDYQFVPFIWGSSQLINHPTFFPSALADEKVTEENKDNYMFFGCIAYINTVKSGPFAEHSNSLWGISSVPHWSKVNSGLIKMYKAEVLSKFPIVQHFLFGTLMSFEKAS